jgi:selenide,water dikinase
MKRLLLVGGGHAHVEVLRRFALRPEPEVAITLISPHRHTPYSGMLPGLVAGHYTFDEAHIDLVPLARWAGATLVHAKVVRLDAAARNVACDNGNTIGFDVCGIDIGSTPDMGVPGSREHTLGVKPVDVFLERWHHEVLRAGSHLHEDVAVVGGGAGGLEILLAMQYAAKTAIDDPHGLPGFYLLTDTQTILPTHAPAVRARFARVLEARGVRVHTGARVVRVEPRLLHCADGRSLHADLIVWATSASAAPWIRESGLAVDADGFMQIDRHLESTSHRCIFGSGDIASLAGAKLPKSGVFAVRKGPVLAHNLRAALRGRRLLPFLPKPTALSLISTGDRYAVMSWGGFSLARAWVWRWKDFIDRRFMAKYRMPAGLPPVPPGSE